MGLANPNPNQMGKLKLAHAELLAALTEQVVSQLKRGGGQGLDAFGVANVAWATLTLTLPLPLTLTLTLTLILTLTLTLRPTLTVALTLPRSRGRWRRCARRTRPSPRC